MDSNKYPFPEWLRTPGQNYEGRIYREFKGYEPYFGCKTVVATQIDDCISMSHGYCYPHPYGKYWRMYAKKHALKFDKYGLNHSDIEIRDKKTWNI